MFCQITYCDKPTKTNYCWMHGDRDGYNKTKEFKNNKLFFTPAWESYGVDLTFKNATEDQIKNEVMFFGASIKDVNKYGSFLTKHFVNTYLSPSDNWIIDSRVHMLMEGWLPCISGFHNDNIERGGSFNQPYYNSTEITQKTDHILIIAGDCSLTEFVSKKQTLELDNPKNLEKVYKRWNEQIKNQINNGLKTYIINPGEVVGFSESDFHRGTPATKSGWRLFIRASRNSGRQFSPDPIRRQVQVYLPEGEQGW